MENRSKYHVPASYRERRDLRRLISGFVAGRSLVPPLSMESLSELAEQFSRERGLSEDCRGWIMVEMHNAVWHPLIAAIPPEKRLLLLPKCLSNSSNCQAEVDELGLLCHRCGRCSIVGLQDRAEELGMMSLVAEGFTSVISLIDSGAVEAVIGVSCLDSLEKAFPLLIKNAVPGLAIPLNVDGCRDTRVDVDYVEELIASQSDEEVRLLDYDYIKREIQDWFSEASIHRLLPDPSDRTMTLALDWLAGDGKRWRPYLLAATYLALSDATRFDERTRLAAIAVECFHKASLVHDDIQDNDSTRYGKQTVNAAYGTPIAINIGDALLGKGYQLLAATGNMDLLRVIADSHVLLCEGQGLELGWNWSRDGLTMDFVLSVYQKKTVPAFEVSLVMGLICAGDDPGLRRLFHDYANDLGIAYQLQDDLEDYADPTVVLAVRPSAVLAIVCRDRAGDDIFRQALAETTDLNAFLRQPEYEPSLLAALEEAREMVQLYHRRALELLSRIDRIELRRLLFRVTERIIK